MGSFSSLHWLKRAIVLCAISAAAVAQPHAPSASRAADWQQGYTLILMNNTGAAAANQARDYVVSQGGRIAILAPPHVMLGWISPDLAKSLPGNFGIESVALAPVDLAQLKYQDAKTRAAVNFFNAVVSGALAKELAAAPTAPEKPRPLIDDALPAPPLNQADYEKNLRPFGVAPAPAGNSDSMTGTVAVALFFVESDGSIDPNTYTWNPADEQDTYNRAVSGLSWWSSQAPNYGVNVAFSISLYSSTGAASRQGYEPILHSSNSDELWISPIMANLGFTSGDRFSRVTAFNTWLKGDAGTDWAYAVFIGYNPAPAPSTFTNGYFAYAYFGGPYTQMLFRNDGWSVEDFGRILSHETGHIFWACDEYYQPGYGGCTSCGPCAAGGPRPQVTNGNCANCNLNAVPCLMRGNDLTLCHYTPLQIGWLDPNCSYAVSPLSRAHGPGPETGTVTVAAGNGCLWKAVSLVPWLTITAGSGGNGNGAVSYAVEANSGEGYRTGVLVVAGQNVEITQAPPVPVCFSDNFDDGNADGWTPLTPSRWQVSNDAGSLRYFLNTTNYDSPDGIRMGEIALTNSGPWGDFVFECLAKSADAVVGGGAADLCIAFGYQDADSYYYINFNETPGLTQLHRVHDGNQATLATYNDATFSDNDYHALRLERSGNQIRAFFDGIELFAVNDGFFGEGQIGVGSYNDSGYFDDIKIDSPACQPTTRPFTDLDAALTAVQQGAVAWGDYDNDGDLDVLLTGRPGLLNPIAKIYRNDGAGNFADINAPLAGVYRSTAVWGDYDNDGDLDILLAGTTNDITAIAEVYRNDNGNFAETFVSLTGVDRSAAAWGDYDNDGDLDVLLTGDAQGSPDKLKIYRNDGGNFVDLNLTIPGAWQGTVAWGDYDNDGDLDFLVTGITDDISAPVISKVYRNDGGNFADIAAQLDGVNAGAAAWGDYDGDGDLDIVLTGLTSGGPPETKIYENNGGNFADAGMALTGVWLGSVAWGDYDNDGDLDILLAGMDFANNLTTKVYRNDSGSFTDIVATLTEVYSSAAAWGDYDNDGDLDILLAGSTGGGQIAKIYRNNTATPNTAPRAPAGLAAIAAQNTVTFNWNKATDGETAQSSLTYNLRVGKTPGGQEVVSPMCEVSTGFRRVVQLGNTNHRNNWTVKNLPDGIYYWSVQAIDNAFAGSAFAAEQSFQIKIPPAAPKDLQITNVEKRVTLTWTANNENDILRYRIYRGAVSPASARIDSVGSFTTTYTDNNVVVGTTYFYRITAVDRDLNESDFSNEVSAAVKPETFTDVGAGLIPTNNASAKWGDYDNDGDLDILLIGSTGLEGLSRVYRNDNGKFVDICAPLRGAGFGSATWGDYDNDGDLDILLAGRPSQNPPSLGFSKIYRNDGGDFVDIAAPLAADRGGMAAWGDYDNDGDLDVLLTNVTSGSSVNAKVYRNDGGNFVDIAAPLTASSSGAWADYDNDGDLDILTGTKIYRNDGGNFVDTGMALGSIVPSVGDYDNDGDLDVLAIFFGTSQTLVRIYRNDSGAFTEITTTIAITVSNALAWGDYDGDGDLDIITGARIYRNDNGSFADAGAALTGSGAIALGDYDNDGDLDMLLGGRLYRNNLNKANIAPTAPANLVAAVNSSAVALSWNKATDNETPQNGLTYNLRLGTSPGGREVVSPMSEAGSGYRRVAQLGNANHNTRWTIKHLPQGTYYWSTQAVDHGLAGSAFAAEQSFVINQAVSTPRGLQATAGFQNVALKWIANRDTSFLRYRIYGGASPNPTTPIDSVEGATNTAKIMSGLTNGTTYYFRLKAVNKALAASPFSNEVSATPFFEPFTEIAASLAGAEDGKAAWGDFDNDGDLDVLVGANVYRNDNRNFVNLNAGLARIFSGDLAWGDYDNDGDLDIFAGSKIHRNDAGSFVDAAAFTNEFSGPAAWGDYDNDGDLDILAEAKIYRNDRGKFVNIPTTLAAGNLSSTVWGDYDNDGDLDILLTGYASNSALISKIYRNDQGNFSDILAPLAALSGVGIWGDYDNDGDLDIFLSGRDASFNSVAKIYRNDSGAFADAAAAFGGFSATAAAWADYDNDGDLDIGAVGADNNSQSFAKIFRNDAGNFVEAAALAGVNRGMAWGDYDNDGDLDLIAITGFTSQATAKIYRNNAGKANTAPSAPTGLAATVSGSTVTINWNKAADNETAANGLTYNLRIGATPGGQEVVSPMSTVNSGYRRVPQLGNANHNARWKIDRLPKGTYYYSVQALDHTFAGSAFAPEKSFVIAVDPPVTAPQSLQAVAAHGEVRLSWQQNPEANLLRYRIYGSTTPDPTAQIDSVDGVANTAKTIRNLANGTTYFFRVSAVDNAGRASALSNQVSATPFFEHFTDVPTNLPLANSALVSWGDYDNDGDLDILTSNKVYRNDPLPSGRNFVDAGIILSGTKPVWGDYDNDGDLDILTSYKVYRNDRGIFVDVRAALATVTLGVALWGDYDNDGDLDIFQAGQISAGRVAKIYRQDNGRFVDINTAIAPATNATAAWGDYDNDGDLDLALSGRDNNFNLFAKIFRNDNGNFVAGAALPTAIENGAVAWGDYDNDGDLDLLMAGGSTKIFRNDAGNFADRGAALPTLSYSFGAWGDYDNDGDLDLLLIGQDSGFQPLGRLYRNDNGSFVALAGAIPNVHSGSVAWGDDDGDGDLDVLLTGSDANYKPLFKILRNNISAPNTVPAPPANLSAVIDANAATLSWNKSSDAQTAANSLTYNLRLGTTPGGYEILSPMSEVGSGLRRVPQLGNVNHNNRWTLRNLPPGKYYWSVQAIDNGLAGSTFAGEQTFTVTLALAAPQHLTAVAGQKKITLTWKAGAAGNLLRYRIYRSTVSPAATKLDSLAASTTKYVDGNVSAGTTYYYRITAVNQALQESPFSNEVNAILTAALFTDVLVPTGGTAWGDYDNDGDLDVLAGLKIYRNDEGNFAETIAGLPAFLSATSTWSDYDNDGDLDILAMGLAELNKPVTKIFRNDFAQGAGFVDINANLTGLSSGAGYWGDYDNDGDLDVLLVGAGISRIYRNDQGAFTDIAAGLKGVSSGSAAWGDYDNDGDPDILLAGAYVAGRIAKIYRNDNGNFADINAPLTPASSGAVAWGDYDSDGDLDVVLTGNRGTANDASINTAEVYRNDNGSFVNAGGLNGVYLSAVAWGDYDNDGDLDLLVTGITTGFPEGSPSATLYRNDAGRLVTVSAGLPGTYSGPVAWGDYDNDGDLDMLMNGAIFRNNIDAENTAPTAPANLAATVAGNAVTFSWNQSTDNQTAPNSLTYNLRLGATPGGVEKSSPMADLTTGYRRVIQLGNANHNLSWTIKKLPKSRFYWSVQAIDNAFAGSAFAPEQTFVLGDTVWPGDANNNRLVNQADVLPIGLYFNKTGPKRDNTSMIWKGQVALPWSPEAATYADANGDGLINQADVLPIGLNWGKTRSQAPLASGENASRFGAATPNLKTIITGDTNPGKTFWLEIHADSVTNLFGISFELLYAPRTNVHLDSMLAGNWLGSDLVFFAFVDSAAGKINLAVTRKSGQGGRDGSGMVARIKMRMSSAAVVGQVTTLNLQDVVANDPAGNPIRFNVINGSIVTSVASRPQAYVPQRFALYPNVPNPFNPSTTIQYDLPQAVEARLEIFDILGRRVRTLVHQHQPAGHYAVIWDARDDRGAQVSSGVFIYQLSAEKFVQSRRLLLLR
jgi:fibronectin type 3 domain-containing protein